MNLSSEEKDLLAYNFPKENDLWEMSYIKHPNLTLKLQDLF